MTEPECPICLGVCQDPVAPCLECEKGTAGKVCRVCYRQWVISSRRVTCPSCNLQVYPPIDPAGSNVDESTKSLREMDRNTWFEIETFGILFLGLLSPLSFYLFSDPAKWIFLGIWTLELWLLYPSLRNWRYFWNTFCLYKRITTQPLREILSLDSTGDMTLTPNSFSFRIFDTVETFARIYFERYPAEGVEIEPNRIFLPAETADEWFTIFSKVQEIYHGSFTLRLMGNLFIITLLMCKITEFRHPKADLVQFVDELPTWKPKQT